MSNDEARRNVEIQSLKATPRVFGIRPSSLFRHSSFEFRHFLHSSFRSKTSFTIIELLVVISIIIILAGLILSTVGYVQKKGARSRAEAEIAAISAALESYKADNGIYPRDNPGNQYTDNLNAKADFDPTQSKYKNASLYLFFQLSGLDANQQAVANMKSYFAFKPQMLGHLAGNTATVAFIRDPFGNSYGYSTANQGSSGAGYNPTFDLWSAGSTASPTPTPPTAWIKNW